MMATSTGELIRSFCREQREWLEEELSASEGGGRGGENKEEDQQQRAQQALHQLQVSDVSVGLYGRTVLCLEKWISSSSPTATASTSTSTTTTLPPQSSSLLLPAHRFTTGDEVEIRSSKKMNPNNTNSNNINKQNNKNYLGGVISEVTDGHISVALFSSKKSNNNNGIEDDESSSLLEPPLSLLAKSSIEVHKKLVAALDELEREGVEHKCAGRIVRALFEGPSTGTSVIGQVRRPEPIEAAADNDNNNNSQQQQQQQQSSFLDTSQSEAVFFCLQDGTTRRIGGSSSSLSHHPVALIHGPPGTGKTTTVVQLIRQAVVCKNWKVLVTAPSNVAVDNVLAKLVARTSSSQSSSKSKKSNRKKSSSILVDSIMPLRVVRLGHPARLQPEILPYSLEALVQRAEGTEIVADVRRELQGFLRLLNNSNPSSSASSSSSKSNKSKNSNNNYNNRRLARQEISALRKEIRVREERVVTDLMERAQVVLATCVGAAHRLLKEQSFDLVIIDEAAQALEAASWIPALHCRTKLVLAGDHCQLPPTITSTKVQKQLGRTMFERLMEMEKQQQQQHHHEQEQPLLSRMLQVQYRMHESIADWASHVMYSGKLQSHETVRHRTLAQLVPSSSPSDDDDDEDDNNNNPSKKKKKNNNCPGSVAAETPPLLLIDTADCDMYESVNAATGSRFNTGEAELVVRHAKHLLGLGLKPEQIAIITPYNGQVEVLRAALREDFPKLEIRSVDGFQGGEREAVILSLVRSSPPRGGGSSGGGIGFLRDDRRLNVAITRSKRHCCVVCDSETVKQSKFIKSLLDWIDEHGEHRSALQYMAMTNNSDGQFQDDLEQAEIELEKMMRYSNNKARTAAKKQDPAEVAEKQRLLVERIQEFAATAKSGEEMLLSSDLSSFDRRVVHEEAEKLGIDHVSEGIESVNRRLKLSIPAIPLAPLCSGNIPEEPAAHAPEVLVQQQQPLPPPLAGAGDVPAVEQAEDEVDDAKPAPSFKALAESQEPDNSTESEDESKHQDEEVMVEPLQYSPSEAAVAEHPDMNSVLANLARERFERQRAKQQGAKQQQQLLSSVKKPNSKKKGGQKLGGTKKVVEPSSNSASVGTEGLDDMAFLDAQIEKNQTAHGRKFDGKGSYRTVMNGILTSSSASSQPKEKTGDPRASAALQSKLKQAQVDRKTKAKKR